MMIQRTTDPAAPRRSQDGAVKAFQVVNVRTGERFGNHTYAEAKSRAQVMCRNWNYREVFTVEVRR